MGIKEILQSSSLAKYNTAIRNTPREVIFNRNLMISSILYSMSAVPTSESNPEFMQEHISSAIANISLQLGIKAHPLSYPHYRASSTSFTSLRVPTQPRSETSSPSYTSAMQPGQLYLSSSMIGLADYGHSVFTARSGSSDSLLLPSPPDYLAYMLPESYQDWASAHLPSLDLCQSSKLHRQRSEVY
jgi:hypothetical protein